jgi:hypothetical protein
MIRLLLSVLFLLPTGAALGQAGEIYLSRVRAPIRVTMMAVYQRFVDEQAIGQFSLPLSVMLPLGTNMGLSLQTSPSSAAGDGVEDLGGLSDARIAFSYFGRLGASSVGANVTANLPSGRRELSREEFRTSVLLSQNFYDFRVPVLGQGFNLAPGVTWAFPVGESLVIGLGGAYQYRGSFTPLDGGTSYDPGDEVLITGGLDAAFDEAWSVSGDVSFAMYQTDTADDEERYRSGNKIVGTLQLLHQSDFNQLRLLGRYRTRARGELPVAGDLVTEEEGTVPDQILVLTSFRRRGSEATYLTFQAQARVFSETVAYPAMTLFDFGVAPEYALSRDWWLVSRFVYTVGDFSGFEGALGLAAQF